MKELALVVDSASFMSPNLLPASHGSSWNDVPATAAGGAKPWPARPGVVRGVKRSLFCKHEKMQGMALR